MIFEYISYGESLIKDLKKDLDTVYIFSDYPLKNSQRKESNRNIFEPDPVYLTIDEFKNRVFKTDKVILSEAKRFVSLYNVMKKEFKELQIESYFESIEFSDKFFKYYTELNKSMCSKSIKLERWQEKYFNIFKRFKDKYQIFLDKHNYIPKDWIEDLRYLDLKELSKYKRIIFIDIVTFSELDKTILRELDKVMEVTVRIQMNKENFDEENLEIKEVKLPKLQNKEMKILEVQDELELIGNLLDIMKMKNQRTNIFSPESETNEYSNIFPNNFMRGKLFVLNDTKFYKFLEIQSNLINSIEYRLKNLIPINKFLDGILSLEMKGYYDLEEKDYEYVYNLIENDYKYIGVETNEKISEIYKDIIEVSKIESIDNFIKYFNTLLENELFREKIYKDMYDKLQEYMGYAKTTEIMLKEKEIKECFRTGGEILSFLLQYFNNVEIIKNIDTEGKYLIKPLENCKVLPKMRESIFINTSNRYLPRAKRDNLFLTEKQKKENGFIFYEKERKEEKYRFYQAILKNNYNTFIYIKNETSGEGITPMLSEVLSKYSVEKLEKSVFSDEVLNKLKELNSQEIEKIEESILPKNKNDFKDGKLSIGAYDFDQLTHCEYRFYLNKIVKLNTFEKNFDYGISMKFLGIYVHYIFEKLTDKMWKKILNVSDYSVDEREVKELLIDSFNFNRKKIPVYLDNYFHQILIPRFTKNIIKFYKEIEKLYIEKNVKRIESEKGTGEGRVFLKGDTNIYLDGRVDLIIETNNSNHVIDFKTGSKIDKQLDFYSIMLYGDEDKAEKSIYNAFEGNLENQEKSKLTKEQLKEMLIEFLRNEEYRMGNKKSGCQYCNYEDICRRDF